jgi:hypothetical protein
VNGATHKLTTERKIMLKDITRAQKYWETPLSPEEQQSQSQRLQQSLLPARQRTQFKGNTYTIKANDRAHSLERTLTLDQRIIWNGNKIRTRKVRTT